MQGLFLIFNLVFGYNQIERGKIWYFNKYKYYFKKMIGACGWETPAPFERAH
jgi:hypothetical protein